MSDREPRPPAYGSPPIDWREFDPRRFGPGHPHAWTAWLMFTPLYMGACLLFDFLPREGPPQFRYAGSDPAATAFNLGWPLALAIYDPRHGFHLGPLAWPTFAVQLLLYAAGTCVVWVRQRTANRIPPPGSDTP